LAPTIRTVGKYLQLAFGLVCLGAIIWYLPFLALAAGAVVVVVAPVVIIYEWFKRRSPETVWLWEETRIVIGRFFKRVFYVVFCVALVGAIWIWYPFEPIGDIPIAQLTLNQIFGNLFGVLLLLVIPVVLAAAALQNDD
jgi:hypothetical protein